jgi:hypothetical protein
MALYIQHTRPAIAVEEFASYYDAFGYFHPHTSYVMDGARGDYRICGEVAGVDLAIDMRGMDVTAQIDPTVQSHADAVSWAMRQIESTPRRASL